MRDINVSLLCVPEVEASTLFGAADAFAACGGLWQALTGQRSSVTCRFIPRIVGASTEPMTSGFGFPVTAQARFSDIDRTDIVYIPSLLITDPAAFADRNQDMIAWIAAQYEQGALIASACTGTLMLAQTGLLDGQEATCHWAAAALLRQNHPNIHLVEQRVLSFAGDGQRLVTAGGASSWQDLCLYLIMRHAGQETAREISRLFLFQWHRDGQSPFAALQRNSQHDDAVIGQAQLWMAENYTEPSALASAIERSGLIERTFSRRFRAATGFAPSAYLQMLRIEEAKQELETSTKPVAEVAETVGYADEASFRRLFRKQVGMSPADYRRRYSFPSEAVRADADQVA